MNDVLIFAGALCALVTLLIIHPPWRRRSRLGPRLLELSGTARDVDEHGFTLETAAGSERVRLDVTVAPPPEGSRVRVGGVVAQQRASETLYRDAGITRVVDAVQLTRVNRERVLRLATVGVLALCMTLAVRLYLRDRTPLQALIARTAQQITCPAGTELDTVGGPPGLFMHACRDPAGNKHGPYGVWTHSGRMRERGTYRRGVRVGTLIEIDPPLFHRDACAIASSITGRTDACPVIAQVTHLDDSGRSHGMAYGYFYPGRQRAYVGTYRRGRRVDTWTYYHPSGHQLYRVTYGKSDATFKYRDEQTGQWCKGGGGVALRWQLDKPDHRCTVGSRVRPIKVGADGYPHATCEYPRQQQLSLLHQAR